MTARKNGWALRILVSAGALALALFVLTGCVASVDDPALLQPSPTSEQPTTAYKVRAYKCAAYLMRVEPIGPVPNIIFVEKRWFSSYYGGSRLANGLYDAWTNTIYVHRSFDMQRVVWHEEAHALQQQRREAYNEWEARKVARWGNDCVNFMPDSGVRQ